MSAKSCSNVFSSFPSLRATALLFRQPLPLFPRRAYCTTTSTFVSILDKRNPSGAGVFFFHTTSPSYSPLYGARLGSHGGRAGSHLSTRGMGGRLPLLADGCTGIMQQCRFLGNKVSGPQLDLFDPKSINLKEEAKYVCRFFSQPALSYLDFKQGCCSLRVFLFLGLMGAVSLDLLLFHPPKSTYWNR
ncbi:transmembrane [Cystoisospora suis]|uniref:Transmembrane n=1 Tax=Cystoisospora suis TaxID=483139 RepID=A0A2C6KVD4_9APIC|nr:transmembrane [Cystoisospora suis]